MKALKIIVVLEVIFFCIVGVISFYQTYKFEKQTPDYREEVRILHEQNQLLKAENNHLDSVIFNLQKRVK